MTIDGKLFHRSNDGVLVAEISELQLQNCPHVISLRNIPEDGMGRTFKLVGTDLSGDDVACWRYEEMDGPNKGLSWSGGHPPKKVPIIRMLIIND